MSELTTHAFRTLGRSDVIPNNFVVPYYLADRKLRVSVPRVGDRLCAFDDLCPCADQPCPLSGRPARRNHDHVPVSRLSVRHRTGRRDQRPRPTRDSPSTRYGRPTEVFKSGSEQRVASVGNPPSISATRRTVTRPLPAAAQARSPARRQLRSSSTSSRARSMSRVGRRASWAASWAPAGLPRQCLLRRTGPSALKWIETSVIAGGIHVTGAGAVPRR